MCVLKMLRAGLWLSRGRVRFEDAEGGELWLSRGRVRFENAEGGELL